jgi:nucleoside-triphosphatase THEP1
MIALLTGEVGCGKTTVCGRIIELLRARDVTVGGILAPARLDADGTKIGIDAVDVATGERRPLADRVPGGGATIGPYTFDHASLNWAAARLLATVAKFEPGRTSPVLIVDEIGPLELVQQSGLVEILGPLADPEIVSHALVIVRQALADTLAARLGRPDVRQFRVDVDNREHMPRAIAAHLGT